MSGILKGMYLDRRTTMKNVLLGVIATCLILITGKMYLGNMQTAQAHLKNYHDIRHVVHALCFVGLSSQDEGSSFNDYSISRCAERSLKF